MTRDRPTARPPGNPLGSRLGSSAGTQQTVKKAGQGATIGAPLILAKPQALDDRTRTTFKLIVESYLSTGEPVGSRNLARGLPMALSPASVRNVMSDLEHLGLIYAPHTSAGRLPTETGLRMFVDGILEVGKLAETERHVLDTQLRAKNENSVEGVLADATEMVSGLSRCAGVVLTDTQVGRLKHIEFVPLEPGKALVVLVGEDNRVENRIIAIPQGLPPSALTEAGNYLNTKIRGLSLAEAKAPRLARR